MRRFWLLFTLVVAATGTAVWFLRIEEIRVDGAVSLSPKEIVEASGLEPGERILWERLSIAERRIEELPAVAEVVAERMLPSTVVLRVRERLPLARLDTADDLVVDADGVIFDAGEAQVRARLYGWKGTAEPGERLDARSRTILEAFPRFPDVLVEFARRLYAGERFRLTLSDRTEIRFGVLRDLEAKAEVAAAVLAEERRRDPGAQLAYIDVRSPTVPVARPRATPTPVPSPTAAPAPAPAPAAGEGPPRTAP